MGENGDCDEAISELYRFLDGDLTEQRRIEIRRHLDECPPCFEQFDFEAELRLVIASKCKDTVPDSLRHRIADVLAGEPDPSI
jgi:mycothiol system anti-sigma-R factor